MKQVFTIFALLLATSAFAQNYTGNLQYMSYVNDVQVKTEITAQVTPNTALFNFDGNIIEFKSCEWIYLGNRNYQCFVDDNSYYVLDLSKSRLVYCGMDDEIAQN